MNREDEPFRMSNSGLESTAAEEREEGGRPARTGFKDTKKIVILAVLMVVGGALAAYQFLGRGPKQATAVVTAAGTESPSGVDVDEILKRTAAPPSDGGGDALSVARIEELVKKFDGYVQERQVPLQNLRANPFALRAPDVQPQPGEVKASASPNARSIGRAGAEEEAAAKARRIRDVASRLVLGSLLLAGRSRMAVISGKLCRVGDAVEGFQVEAIESDRVRLSCEGETVDLVLPSNGAQDRLKGSMDGR
jgi:hypothetical protein